MELSSLSGGKYAAAVAERHRAQDQTGWHQNRRAEDNMDEERTHRSSCETRDLAEEILWNHMLAIPLNCSIAFRFNDPTVLCETDSDAATATTMAVDWESIVGCAH